MKISGLPYTKRRPTTRAGCHHPGKNRHQAQERMEQSFCCATSVFPRLDYLVLVRWPLSLRDGSEKVLLIFQSTCEAVQKLASLTLQLRLWDITSARRPALHITSSVAMSPDEGWVR